MPSSAWTKMLHGSGGPDGYSYERTLMCGVFRDELRGAARDPKKRDDFRQSIRRKKTDGRLPVNSFEFQKKTTRKQRISHFCTKKCARPLKVFGEDWFFLAALGVLMAFCSFLMDFCIEKLQETHHWLYEIAVEVHWTLGYLAWMSYTVVLVLLCTGFVHFMAPQAIGSGIPEMKTVLRGVVLKEYLTFRTLVSKAVGLTVSLGSGLPIGKEGPFVHVASIVATLLSRLITTFKGIYENESRNSEMLAAACAVGVACTFGAPVGGVLFSIEVTSVYFAVRNYWRGFFAAACSATVFRLLAVWFKKEVTVVAFYKTSFPVDYPFYPEELIPFALIGVICGFGGALFVYTHRTIVLFMRKNKLAKFVLKKNLAIYPAVVSWVISTAFFPLGPGKYNAGVLNFRQAINHFFSNFSWIQSELSQEQQEIVNYWSPDGTNVFVTLTGFTISIFLFGAVSNTLPLPAGVFIPVFVIGAAFGRLSGEAMCAWFPYGIRGVGSALIVPGGYAVVGAAAFVGSVTHTVSVSVIVFELTGQLAYILPVMISVLIANAICAYLQPSIYDSMIRIKHLPYLPDIPPASSTVHNVHADQIMVREVKFLSKHSTYREAQDILVAMPRLRAFPLVDRAESMILLGSIPRRKLEELLEEQVGESSRKNEAMRRRKERFGNTLAIPTVAPILVATANADDSATDSDPTSPAAGKKDSRFTVARVEEEKDGKSPPKRVKLEIPTIITEESGDERRSSLDNSNINNNHHHHYNPFNTVQNVYNTANSYVRSVVKAFTWGRPSANETEMDDLAPEERAEWEKSRLDEQLDFAALQIDPAPFQLVERTSLFKVHSLFSLLGMNRAYVTNCGRLIGVVALRELRAALERGAQTGFRASTSQTRLSLPEVTDRSVLESPLQVMGTRNRELSAQLEDISTDDDDDTASPRDNFEDTMMTNVDNELENGKL